MIINYIYILNTNIKVYQLEQSNTKLLLLINKFTVVTLL